MQKKTREKYILIIVGSISILAAVLGYSGLYSKITADPYQELRLETHRVVDYAQIWYSKPKVRDGGGRSFYGLNFESIGIPEGQGTSYINETGEFRLRNIRNDMFDLEVVAKDGVIFIAKDLSSITHAVLVKKLD